MGKIFEFIKILLGQLLMLAFIIVLFPNNAELVTRFIEILPLEAVTMAGYLLVEFILGFKPKGKWDGVGIGV